MDEQKMPKTFEEAVDYLCAAIKPEVFESPYYHFTTGMSVRNNLGLWDKTSPLHKHMAERFGLCHADDTGSLISSAAHAKLDGREYDPEADVQKFKKHWLGYGLDPKTMEKIEGVADLNQFSETYEIQRTNTPASRG